MSNHVSYQGRHLGNIRLDENHKWIYVADSLDALETLLGLKPGDVIDLEDHRPMPYGEFREQYLRDIHAFYPTEDDWLLKNTSARTLEEFEASKGHRQS